MRKKPKSSLLCRSQNRRMTWAFFLTNVCTLQSFVLVQIFWASPKIWLHLVPFQNLLCQHKNQSYWMQIILLSGTKCLWLPQYVNKFLVWHKRCGPAQNILGPVKGQGISILAASNRSTALPYPSVLGFWKIKFDKLDF